MTHKVNSKGVAIEHPPNNKVKRIRNGINQLGPEKRYTHTKYKTSFLDVEKKYYTFAQAKAKGWVTQKDQEKYNKKLKRAENKPEMFDPPGLTIRQINSIKSKKIMSKKLQADSKYAMADTDGDGIITDDEMDRHERWIRLENEDKMMDTQRTMAWLAMGTTIVTVILLLTPIINVARMESASGFLNTFLVAQMGVVLGFMGATALTKTKSKE